MDLTVGAILEGTVKSITKFGAFVALPEGKTGMVHISEIAHAYVSDIHEHLTEGQAVKVMVMAVDPAGNGGVLRLGDDDADAALKGPVGGAEGQVRLEDAPRDGSADLLLPVPART